MTKKKRIENKELLESYRVMPCAVKEQCFGPVAGHHIKSRGSGGDDIELNLLPLCQKHHSEVHQIGSYTMECKYQSYKDYLRNLKK